MAERRSGKDGEEVEDGEVTIREVAMIGKWQCRSLTFDAVRFLGVF